MLAVEERCLESLAWAQGSSLYPTLIAAVGSHGGGASGSGGGSSASERASLEAAPAGGSHEPACSPTSSPSVGDSVGGGERRAGSVTPRKRGLEEMAAPGGADGADADMADAAPPLVHPPEHQQGAASAPAPGGGTLGSATQPHSQRWPPQRERRHQHEQSGVDTPGRLPLSLGSEPRAAAAVRGASGDQQPASTDAAGPASALMPRGDRSARSAVSCSTTARQQQEACVWPFAPSGGVWLARSRVSDPGCTFPLYCFTVPPAPYLRAGQQVPAPRAEAGRHPPGRPAVPPGHAPG